MLGFQFLLQISSSPPSPLSSSLFSHSGQEIIWDLIQGSDWVSTEMGWNETDWGQLEVHDGVWVWTHWEKLAHLCSVSSQGAHHSDCKESYWAWEPPQWFVSKTCCFEGNCVFGLIFLMGFGLFVLIVNLHVGFWLFLLNFDIWGCWFVGWLCEWGLIRWILAWVLVDCICFEWLWEGMKFKKQNRLNGVEVLICMMCLRSVLCGIWIGGSCRDYNG